ncbi:DUF4194 domain-containing protein [Mycobacterium sp. KBS0706]|uniref:DUF4194 domain-containing protein n=1 Tax=Mycobacterium sp. KBS0706 TaxID=2578109 RepID=UPI00163DB765|nr:DUF4194 domain-containing protein [Mycobacterium sp. KBS0706]
MLGELKELRDLVDLQDDHRPGRGMPEPPTEEEVTRCIQVLMSRQCIYPHQHHLARSYNIMATVEYQGFFRKYFSAMGLDFHFDTRSRMVALRFPAVERRRYDWQASRLKRDETLVLLALKLAYEEGFRANIMGARGDVEITTNDLVDKLEMLARVTIEETRLNEILGLLKRKGVLELGERDPVERVRPLTILSGIEVAVPESYVQQISDWVDQLPAAAPDSVEPGDGSEGGDDESDPVNPGAVD